MQKLLEILVKIKLNRIRPTIIGITGSIGKTSTKDAIYEVLKTKWKVFKNPKSLNTEIGLLLAILEQPSGFSSTIKWAQILGRAVKNAFNGIGYDFLVLEYGADKPWDIKHLTSLVKPHIGIITKISRVHQDAGQFEGEKDVFEEKKRLVECLDEQNVAILNADDKYLRKLHGKLRAKTFWYSTEGHTEANLSIYHATNTASGILATIQMDNQKFKAQFDVPGIYHLNIMLPALMCGVLNGVTIEEGISALKNFRLPPGRMSIIEGKNGAVILDSSYNASLEAVKEALNLLREFPGKRKIAVIGNMNELGDYAVEAHKDVAKNIGPWLDELVTVGQMASLIAEQLLKKGWPESKIKILLTADEAGKYLVDRLHSGDIVLLKGSQNRVRLERAVKMLMANPAQAPEILCRQEPEWKNIE